MTILITLAVAIYQKQTLIACLLALHLGLRWARWAFRRADRRRAARD
jgi:hypothetical protein